jgi:hypothetical protein
MADITPGEKNDVQIGTEVFGDKLNQTQIVDYVLLVDTAVSSINGIFGVGGPGGQQLGVRTDGASPGGGGAGVIGNGGIAGEFEGQPQPPGPGVIGNAGTGGDADGVRGNGSGSFSGVAGVADSSVTANSGIGVFGHGGGPKQPPPGQQAQPGGPGVQGIAGKNQFGSNANGVEGFGSGTFSGVAGFGDPSDTGTGVFGEGRGPGAPGVRGIGSGGPNTVPGDPAGVYGQAGRGNANGVEGHGSGELGAGVAGLGDPANSGTGVLGVGRGPSAPGVRGIGSGSNPDTSRSISQSGVFGQAGSGNANGVEGRGSGNFAGVAGFGDVSNGAGSGIGVFAVGGAPAPRSSQRGGPGVHAVGAGGAPFTPLNQEVGVYGLGGVNNAPGVLGQGGSATADGVHGISTGGSGINGESGTGAGVTASSASGAGVKASSESGTGVVASSASGTGLIAAGGIVPGSLAAQFDGNVLANDNVTVEGNVTVNGDLTVKGARHAAVAFPDGTHRVLYCLESPESWFEDFGFGTLVNGRASIRLDPDFASTVHTDQYHVFVTEYDNNSALYVTARSATGFELRADAGAVDASFSYRVVAKRKDIEGARLEKIHLPAPPRRFGEGSEQD